MCELTFINSKNVTFNRVYLNNQLKINSIQNRDGVGFLYGNKIYRNDKSAIDVPSLWENIALISERCVLAHTRLASSNLSTGEQFSINIQNTHPFDGKYLVLAHNGTLRHLSKPMTGDKVDSLVFLEELETEYEREKDLIKSLSNTINKFFGSYAFLIYEKENKKYYAVKDRNRKLHYCYITEDENVIGYVINTDSSDLVLALSLSIDSYNLLKISKGKLSFTDIKPFDDLSIYELGDTIRKLDILLPDIAIKRAEITPWYKKPSKAVEMMRTYNLEIDELDKIIADMNDGNGILTIYDENIFYEVENKIIRIYDEEKANLWNKIKGESIKTLSIYDKFNLRFPYMLNSKKKLLSIIKRDKNDKDIEQ